MAQILVVEDDPETSQAIAARLAIGGHEVVTLANGREAFRRACDARFDAITMDRMMPGMDGLELVARLRAAQIATPVLMISAMGDVDQRIEGLRAGGDDYLVKPFSVDEMAVRIDVLLRRQAERPQDGMLVTGDIEMDLINRKVWVGGEAVQLLHKEFRLLEFFARHPGEILGRRLIFEQVWGGFFDPGANLINVHIGKLRRKLERPGRPTPIETIKGEGYRLVAG